MRPVIRNVLLVGLLVLAAGWIIFGLIQASHGPGARYRDAVRMTERDACRDAAPILEALGDYRDAKVLLNYCRAYMVFDEYDPSTFAKTHEYLDKISYGYSGECDWKVSYLRSSLTLAELPSRPAVQSKSEYADELPFEGMPASSVSKSILGAYSSKESIGGDLTRFKWISRSGDIYFYAIGDVWTITEVSKCNDSLYWDGDTYCPNGVQSQPATAQTDGTVSSNDPFDARSYSEPNDFYYDYPDDFVDYEDAEDYWNAHQ